MDILVWILPWTLPDYFNPGLRFLTGNLRCDPICFGTEKNGFVTATKLGTKNEFFVASTKNFAAATKRFL